MAAVLDVEGARLAITTFNVEDMPERVRSGDITCKIAFRDPVGGFAAYWVDPEHSEVTEIGSPRMGACTVHVGSRWVSSEVLDVGRRDLNLRIPNVTIPGPHDAGAPVAQDGRIVGMLYMYFLEDDCVGRAVRMDLIRERVKRALNRFRGRYRARRIRS